MKNKRIILLQLLVGILPLLFLLSIWESLPDQVPTHYNARFEPDNFGTRPELGAMLFFFFLVGILVSLLLRNIHKIDPKNKYSENHPLMQKLSWSIIVFTSAIGIYLVYQAQQFTAGESSSPRILIGVLALCFAVLGNFMNSLKPNYFVGIRTPWNLKNEENWKYTHHIASRLWFFGGLLLLIAAFFVHESLLLPLLLTTLILLVLIPLLYSYRFYSISKNNF